MDEIASRPENDSLCAAHPFGAVAASRAVSPAATGQTIIITTIVIIIIIITLIIIANLFIIIIIIIIYN